MKRPKVLKTKAEPNFNVSKNSQHTNLFVEALAVLYNLSSQIWSVVRTKKQKCLRSPCPSKEGDRIAGPNWPFFGEFKVTCNDKKYIKFFTSHLVLTKKFMSWFFRSKNMMIVKVSCQIKRLLINRKKISGFVETRYATPNFFLTVHDLQKCMQNIISWQ